MISFPLAAEVGCRRVELSNDPSGRGIIDGLETGKVREPASELDVEIIAANALQKFNLDPLLSRVSEELDTLIAL